MKFYSLNCILVFFLLITSCQVGNEKVDKSNNNTSGPKVIKSYYEKSGELKTEITVLGNKKNGPAKKYYPTGELHTTVNYINNKKEGETIWYYKNGQPYRVTPYRNGKMHGIRKKYYENGKLQVEIPYKRGKLVEGTKEYTKDGNLITNTAKIIFETEDNLRFENKYLLKMKLSKKMKNIEFFEEKTTTEGTKILVPIKTNLSGTGKIEYILSHGSSKVTVLNIYAQYESKLKNPVLISTTYNLSIEN